MIDDSAQEIDVIENAKNIHLAGVNWQLFVLLALFVAVIFVSIKTVVQRHEARVSFMQLQKLEKERDNLAAKWSSLKLEQGSVLGQVRVEKLAFEVLGMRVPKTSNTKLIRESVSPAVSRPILSEIASSD